MKIRGPVSFNMKYDCLVVGGGPAGLMAAISAAESGSERVVLLEKNNRLGWKLSITGKGRCNVTNNCGMEELMENIPVNSRFLYSAFNRFGPSELMDFFENHGLTLKTERGNRVFPASDQAAEVVMVLENTARELGVEIHLNSQVKHLVLEEGVCLGVSTARGDYLAEKTIIACGGASYPKTGSNGEGYRLAQEAGHTIAPIRPSLVPIVTKERGECEELMGVSLRNVTLSLEESKSGRTIFKEQGEMLFTHFGMSGPLVLSASAHIRPKSPGEGYRILLDLKPALNKERLDARLLRDFGESPNKTLGNAALKLLPGKMASAFVKRSGINPETRLNSITKEQRMVLVDLLKAYPFNFQSFRPIDEAIVTSGGVAVKEVEPKTMGSKLAKGLFFAGEMLDVDGYTGGFNLQIAFSTGYAAGMSY